MYVLSKVTNLYPRERVQELTSHRMGQVCSLTLLKSRKDSGVRTACTVMSSREEPWIAMHYTAVMKYILGLVGLAKRITEGFEAYHTACSEGKVREILRM